MESGAVPSPGINKSEVVVSESSASIQPAQSTSIQLTLADTQFSAVTAESVSRFYTAEIFDNVQNAYRNWENLNKYERAEKLTEVSGMISKIISYHTALLTKELNALPALNIPELKDISLEACRSLTAEELSREKEIRSSIEAIKFAINLFQSGPVAMGKNEFASSTGALDSTPRLSSSIAACFASAGLAASVWTIIATHHAVFHAAETIASLFSSHGSVVNTASTYAIGIGGLFVESTFLIGLASAGCAMLYGSIKSAAGVAKRSLSKEAREEFENQKCAADKLQNAISETCKTTSDALFHLSAKLPEFYQRNNIIRSLAAVTSWKAIAAEEDNEMVTELQKKVRELGVHEIADIWEILSSQKKISLLAKADIRSPLLKDSDSKDDKSEKLSLFARAVKLAKFGFRSIKNIKDTSATAGMEPALQAATSLHHALDSMPRSPLDAVTGMGSSLSSALELAIQSGLRPEQALLDAITEGISLVNFGQDMKHGPGALEAISHGLEFSELKKGNYLRWLSKMLVRGPMLALKKPFILIELSRKEAAKGNINPAWLSKELENQRGRFSAFIAGCKVIAESLWQALVTAGGKTLRDRPLEKLSRAQLMSPFLNKLIPLPALEMLQEIYRKKESTAAASLRLTRRKIRNGEKIAMLSTEELKNECVKAVIDFSNPQSAISYRELKLMIDYWEKSELLWLTRRKIRQLNHLRELTELDASLHKSIKQIRKNKPHRKEANNPADDTTHIIDVLADNTLLVLSAADKLDKLKPSKFQRKVIYDFYRKDGEKQINNRIPENADQVRLAAIQNVTEILEPLQQRAVLEAHHGFKNGSLYTMARLLAESHFTEELLFGTSGWTKESLQFPGVFRLGFIGNSIPSDDLIESVRAKLKSAGLI